MTDKSELEKAYDAAEMEEKTVGGFECQCKCGAIVRGPSCGDCQRKGFNKGYQLGQLKVLEWAEEVLERERKLASHGHAFAEVAGMGLLVSSLKKRCGV